MTASGQQLELLPETYAVARLGGQAEVPAWALTGALSSITRTAQELSILCPQSSMPAEVEAQRGFRCLRVVGPLEFDQVGVLESMARPLALAGVSIFVISTYNTDYLLLPASDLERGIAALSKAGHEIHRHDGS